MIVFILAGILLGSPSNDGIADTNASAVYVSAVLTASPPSLKAGQPGELLLRFRPASGIHIAGEPAVTIHLDTTSVVVPGGPLTQETDSTSGSLRANVPVRLRVALRPGAEPGTYLSRATVSYFYCSDAEGWCRKKSDILPFTITISR
jgi:hypothetical protein